jgi:hypothetical protein
MDTSTPPGAHDQGNQPGTVRAELLAADLASARTARRAVRDALAAWGIGTGPRTFLTSIEPSAGRMVRRT